MKIFTHEDYGQNVNCNLKTTIKMGGALTIKNEKYYHTSGFF